ncbi:G2/mitotic-specific cyclin [Coemansia sp. BCRC 34301]|nr:G2/mitotic-specific cyclin [Coemansia sp. BCRC 34301]
MASLAARKARLPLSSVDAGKSQIFRDPTSHVLRPIPALAAPPTNVLDVVALPSKAALNLRPIRAPVTSSDRVPVVAAPPAEAPRPIRALRASSLTASNVAVAASLAAKPVVTRVAATAEMAKAVPLAGQKRPATAAEPERKVRPRVSEEEDAAPGGLKRRSESAEDERMVQAKLAKDSSASVARREEAENKSSAAVPDSDSADSQATAVEHDLPADVRHRRIAKPSHAFSTLRTLAGQAIQVRPVVPVAADATKKAEDEAVRDWDDIDAEDGDDPLMVSEYIEDIIEYLRKREVVTLPEPTYMDNQRRLTWDMRCVLVNWMIQTHYQLRMLPETLFLAVNIVDRFLTKRQVAMSKFQLVGATALMLACKYEETSTPHIDDFVYLSGSIYTPKEILQTEVFLLTVLDFDMSFPNPMTFLRRVSKAEDYNMQTRTVAKYLMEVSLVDHRLIKFTPSCIAAASIYAGRRMLESGPWTANLRHYSGYTAEELEPVAALMFDHILNQHDRGAFVYRKYEHRRYLVVSKFCYDWTVFHQREVIPMTPPTGYFTSATDADSAATAADAHAHTPTRDTSTDF